MFADNVNGAKASASLYSLVQTVRANEIEPNAYLRRMLAQLPKAETVEQIEVLATLGCQTQRVARVGKIDRLRFNSATALLNNHVRRFPQDK